MEYMKSAALTSSHRFPILRCFPFFWRSGLCFHPPCCCAGPMALSRWVLIGFLEKSVFFPFVKYVRPMMISSSPLLCDSASSPPQRFAVELHIFSCVFLANISSSKLGSSEDGQVSGAKAPAWLCHSQTVTISLTSVLAVLDHMNRLV